jgi:hypothetical protein
LPRPGAHQRYADTWLTANARTQWPLGVEYDYFNLGYSGFSAAGILGHTYIVTKPSHLTVDQVVGRLTYKFGIP